MKTISRGKSLYDHPHLIAFLISAAVLYQKQKSSPQCAGAFLVLIRDGIEAVKRFLIVNPVTNRPLLNVNARCTGLISEMGGCPNPISGQIQVYKWRQDKEGNTLADDPEDRNNHASKALAYGIVHLFGYAGTSLVKPKITFH